MSSRRRSSLLDDMEKVAVRLAIAEEEDEEEEEEEAEEEGDTTLGNEEEDESDHPLVFQYGFEPTIVDESLNDELFNEDDSRRQDDSDYGYGAQEDYYGYEQQDDHHSHTLDDELADASIVNIQPLNVNENSTEEDDLGSFLHSGARSRGVSVGSTRLSGSSTGTTHSAPAATTDSASLDQSTLMHLLPRRQTFNVPLSRPNSQHNNSRRAARRQQISISGPSAVTDSFSSSSGSSHSRMPLHRSVLTARRAMHLNTRQSQQIAGSRLNMSDAVNRLGMTATQDGTPNNWENVLAAATVVAASAQTPSLRTTQFGQGDKVLCMITLLNITNHEDDPLDFTVDPVNVHGYPIGEGKIEAERSGPYSFVLGTVVTVHFDEDERYYTVKRHDTDTEQRADPQWMELCLGGLAGLHAAEEAAKRTGKAAENFDDQPKRARGLFSVILEWPMDFMRGALIPCLIHLRSSAKVILHKLLTGDKGYGCRFKLTCVNLLVLCSFTYLLIEPFTYSLLPASLDRASMIVEMVVWCILVVELFFEYLIRPPGYNALVESEKAYWPATARYISHFHLVFESVALILFIPQIPCLLIGRCGDPIRAISSLEQACVLAVLGTSNGAVAIGRFIIGLNSLRTFGLIRHWKQMWIKNVFDGELEGSNSLLQALLIGSSDSHGGVRRLFGHSALLADDESGQDMEKALTASPSSSHDQQLKDAACIGTSLMVVNTHRSLALYFLIVAVYPMMYTLGLANRSAQNSVKLLAENNVISNSTSDCDYFRNAVYAWIKTAGQDATDIEINGEQKVYIPHLLWAQVLPVRCDWQQPSGVITSCDGVGFSASQQCDFWNMYNPMDPSDASPEYFANVLNMRVRGITEYTDTKLNFEDFSSFGTAPFTVKAIFDDTISVTLSMFSLFILLICMLILGLASLTVMRADVGRLVLGPLRRMLKIVVRYAENPLSDAATEKPSHRNDNFELDKEHELGNYETEQLITTVSKIADLLRKCWGVAGAGIIQQNLARTEAGATVVFNPTVPGKRVYALFGFVAVNDFSRVLDLGNDVLILINDIAKVLHEEVYRWALGDSGQCNKNLGGAFLMVFRIGDFTDVHDKKKRATDVVFNTSATAKRSAKAMKKKQTKRRAAAEAQDSHLTLASLPGIQAFTDRALLGLLKSFAGIHRDRKLQEWRKDFRLGGGVGAYFASAIFGMDAGWAVEGAVGSEHKIDATYLSPHVNMASRMMSASKQYGVTLLMSQAVEELMSRAAREKLRHLDTVYVKGSSVPQRIFTYDARYEGVQFFLYERPQVFADLDAECYSPAIWNVDQDLKAMRQHVTEEFMQTFKDGVDLYLEGKWEAACMTLAEADNIMIRTVLEEGYIDLDNENIEDQIFDENCDDEDVMIVRSAFGDGACRCLIQYMQRRNCTPPDDWHGVRQLMSK